MIRHATFDDTYDIVELVKKFYQETSYSKWADFDNETVTALTTALIEGGVVLVADVGKVVGVVGLYVGPHIFNKNKTMATEVIYWLDAKYQNMGLGKELLEGIEPACKEAGVDAIQMVTLSTSPPVAAALYEKAGFKLTEHSFTKVI